MSASHFYDVCCRHKGKPVRIRTRDGCVHKGTIRNVDRNQVFLQPMGRSAGLGGFGYGFFGPGFGGYGYGGYGYGYGAYGIALGAITALALLPFFFW
ncbi:hypothetical protein [Lentibacillus cibarius]|uniref:hypothetical protein n=1 Tax=Lentibacillus cibarius TaxID=2583219 RepID=UPI00159FC364|nr:hypothetical protein [Lentibacillus cibarius]